MGIFDKAKDLASEHSDKIDQGIEKGGDLIDQKTGGKYAEHVDKGQEFVGDKADDFLGTDEAPAQAPGQDPAQTPEQAPQQ